MTVKSVGRRIEPPLAVHASGEFLAEGARFNEVVARLSRAGYMPKGVYRYKSQEEANQHEQDCLVHAIARLALERRHG